VVIAHALSPLPKHAWLASDSDIIWGTNNSSNNKHTINTRVSCRKEEEQQLSQAAPSSVDNRRNSQKSDFISGAGSRVTLQVFGSTRLRRARFKSYIYIFAPKMEKSEVTSICHLIGLLFECVESDWQTSSWKGFTGMQTQAKISRNERNLMT